MYLAPLAYSALSMSATVPKHPRTDPASVAVVKWT